MEDRYLIPAVRHCWRAPNLRCRTERNLVTTDTYTDAVALNTDVTDYFTLKVRSSKTEGPFPCPPQAFKLLQLMLPFFSTTFFQININHLIYQFIAGCNCQTPLLTEDSFTFSCSKIWLQTQVLHASIRLTGTWDR